MAAAIPALRSTQRARRDGLVHARRRLARARTRRCPAGRRARQPAPRLARPRRPAERPGAHGLGRLEGQPHGELRLLRPQRPGAARRARSVHAHDRLRLLRRRGAGREHRLRPDRRQRRHERLAQLARPQARTSSSRRSARSASAPPLPRTADLLGAGLRRWSELRRPARVRAAAAARATRAGAAPARRASGSAGSAACGTQARRRRRLLRSRRPASPSSGSSPADTPSGAAAAATEGIGSALLPVSTAVTIRDARRHKARSTRLVVAKPHAGEDYAVRMAFGPVRVATENLAVRCRAKLAGKRMPRQGRDRRSRRHLHMGDPRRRGRQAAQAHGQGHGAPRHLARAPREG